MVEWAALEKRYAGNGIGGSNPPTSAIVFLLLKNNFFIKINILTALNKKLIFMPGFSFFQKVFLFFLRVSMGWMFFYAGITKVLDPQWSAEGFLKGAKTLTAFYQFLLQPEILPIVNFTNKWGLTLLGISLILGIFVRLSSVLGASLMVLYYLPILKFPYPNPNSYIVDQHIVFALVLLFFAAIRAGRIFGLEHKCANLPLCSKFPRLRNWLG